jgi:hypothetical protein
MTNDYAKYFAQSQKTQAPPTTPLPPCSCGASPETVCFSDYVMITCPKNGCRQVEAKTKEEAEALWSEKDFRWHQQQPGKL